MKERSPTDATRRFSKRFKGKKKVQTAPSSSETLDGSMTEFSTRCFIWTLPFQHDWTRTELKWHSLSSCWRCEECHSHQHVHHDTRSRKPVCKLYVATLPPHWRPANKHCVPSYRWTAHPPERPYRVRYVAVCFVFRDFETLQSRNLQHVTWNFPSPLSAMIPGRTLTETSSQDNGATEPPWYPVCYRLLCLARFNWTDVLLKKTRF